MSDERIKFAFDLAIAGQKEDARNVLRDILRQDRDNALAWSAYARVAKNREQAVHALEQMLRLRPDNEWAQQGLQKLEGVISFHSQKATE
jgi:Tfp pilus assembly protein PilF